MDVVTLEVSSLFLEASAFYFRNASFLLAFLLTEEGLNFFLTISVDVDFFPGVQGKVEAGAKVEGEVEFHALA